MSAFYRMNKDNNLKKTVRRCTYSFHCYSTVAQVVLCCQGLVWLLNEYISTNSTENDLHVCRLTYKAGHIYSKGLISSEN